MKFNKKILFAFGLMIAFAAAATQAAELAAPPANAVDKYGVNMTSGQVTTSVDTVAIGGELGLSHKLSTSSNNLLSGFTNGSYTYYGFRDPFDGTARYEKVAEKKYIYTGIYGRPPASTYFDLFYVMRVFDGSGSADFKVLVSGSVLGYTPCYSVSTCPANYSYEAMGDIRNTLDVIDCEANSGAKDCLKWTKPNGAETYYRRGPNSFVTAKGYIWKIVQPNGFTITVNSSGSGVNAVIRSVNTNTGFQLKYYYTQNLRGLPPEKASATNNSAVPADSPTWSSKNPSSIVAVNNSVEYCDASSTADIFAAPTCNLNNMWPSASVAWPDGMPRAMFIGQNTITITTAKKQIARYVTEARDLWAGDANMQGQTYVPRFINFKDPASQLTTANYVYAADKITCLMCDAFGTWVSASEGTLSSITGMKGNVSYTIGQQMSQGPFHIKNSSNANSAYGWGPSVMFMSDLLGGIYTVANLNGSATMQSDYRNFAASATSVDGPSQTFTYDDTSRRGNLVKITYNDGSASSTFVEADYPTSCTNRKTCNQALWVSDAKGNKTYYTYHTDSGQVETVTLPPNKNGISQKNRYQYEQKSGYIKNSANTKVLAGTPIWLKTSEKTCSKTATIGDACSGGEADEIVTRFEYNHDNLLMTGKTVKAADSDGNIITKRICYKYDIYGNKISETQPKENLASCN